MKYKNLLSNLELFARTLGIPVDDIKDNFQSTDELSELMRLLRRDAPVELKAGAIKRKPEAIQQLQEIPVNVDFLKSVEGYTTRGVIPRRKDGSILGKSGVTVGIGIDLGQQDVKGLKKAGVPPDIIQKVQPYLGLRKEMALDKLKQSPLRLTKDEADELSMKVIDYNDDALEQKFTKASGVSFHSLPREAQTILRSVSHQYGDLEKATPRFWEQMTNKRFDDAADELENFGDDYPTRRSKEAQLLRGSYERT